MIFRPLYFFEEKISFRGADLAIPELCSSCPVNIFIMSSQSLYEMSIASMGYSRVLENAAVYEYHACRLEITPVLSCSEYILAFDLRCSICALWFPSIARNIPRVSRAIDGFNRARGHIVSSKFLATSSPGRSCVSLYFHSLAINLKSRKYQKALFPSSTPIAPPVALRIPSHVSKASWAWCRTSDGEVFGSLAECIMSVSSTNAKPARTVLIVIVLKE